MMGILYLARAGQASTKKRVAKIRITTMLTPNNVKACSDDVITILA